MLMMFKWNEPKFDALIACLFNAHYVILLSIVMHMHVHLINIFGNCLIDAIVLSLELCHLLWSNLTIACCSLLSCDRGSPAVLCRWPFSYVQYSQSLPSLAVFHIHFSSHMNSCRFFVLSGFVCLLLSADDTFFCMKSGFPRLCDVFLTTFLSI